MAVDDMDDTLRTLLETLSARLWELRKNAERVTTGDPVGRFESMVIHETLSMKRDIDRALSSDGHRATQCDVQPYSSRMCEVGTKGCEIVHLFDGDR